MTKRELRELLVESTRAYMRERKKNEFYKGAIDIIYDHTTDEGIKEGINYVRETVGRVYS